MHLDKKLALAALSMALSGVVSASPFTSTSPTGVDVTTVGASTVGGIVFDFVGANGAHVVSQMPASSLFVGFANDGTPVAFRGNPFTIGIGTGFNNAITGALGGGLSRLAVRFTLYDGDSANFDFDDGDLTLRLNGVDVGNWSDVNAQQTNGVGSPLGGGFSGGGFRNNLLDTGWFDITDSTALSSIFSSLVSTETMIVSTFDVDPFDNFYDFTQGIDAGLIDVGTPPVVTPPTGTVPEPSTLALLGLAFLGLGAARRWR